MSIDIIKQHYIIKGEIDRFTKMIDYELRDDKALSLDTTKISKFLELERKLKAINSASNMAENVNEFDTLIEHTEKFYKISNPELKLLLKYTKNGETDTLLMKLDLQIYAPALDIVNYLRNSQIIFLINDDESIIIKKIKDYNQFEMDISTITILASSSKVEYRVSTKTEILSEGEMSEDNLYNIRGFYNALFDSEFMKDEILNHIETETKSEIEKVNKKDTENKQLNKEHRKANQKKTLNTSKDNVIDKQGFKKKNPILGIMGVVLIIATVYYFVVKYEKANTDNSTNQSLPEANSSMQETENYSSNLAKETIDTVINSSNVGEKIDDYVKYSDVLVEDLKTNSFWYVAPDKGFNFEDAITFAENLQEKNLNWRIPTYDEIKKLYNPNYSAGSGFFKDNKFYPSKIHSVFNSIGSGSWFWVSDINNESSKAYAINLHEGVRTTFDSQNPKYPVHLILISNPK